MYYKLKLREEWHYRKRLFYKPNLIETTNLRVFRDNVVDEIIADVDVENSYDLYARELVTGYKFPIIPPLDAEKVKDYFSIDEEEYENVVFDFYKKRHIKKYGRVLWVDRNDIKPDNIISSSEMDEYINSFDLNEHIFKPEFEGKRLIKRL